MPQKPILFSQVYSTNEKRSKRLQHTTGISFVRGRSTFDLMVKTMYIFFLSAALYYFKMNFICDESFDNLKVI